MEKVKHYASRRKEREEHEALRDLGKAYEERGGHGASTALL